VLGKVFKFFGDFFINLYPRLSAFPKFGVCRGALLRARAEFGVKGNKALFLTLGILGISNSRHFLSVFICVHLCPDRKFFGCGFAAL
jgi:hypothetical protein